MVDQSRTVRVFRAVEERVSKASKGSTLVERIRSLTTHGAALFRQSYCYRWLTAEPDPEVIVIDLREARTVGPFIQLLEMFIAPLERAWKESRLQSIATDIESRLGGSRAAQLVTSLLDPPEPPEGHDDEETD